MSNFETFSFNTEKTEESPQNENPQEKIIKNKQDSKLLEQQPEVSQEKDPEQTPNQEKQAEQQKENTIEQSKEEKEMHEYLEKVVFKELELTPEDEEKELARIKQEIKKHPDKVPPVMERITKRSFQKTREYLQDLFTEFSLVGVATPDELKRKRIEIINEIAPKYNLPLNPNYTGKALDFKYFIPMNTKWDEIQDIIEKRLRKECPVTKIPKEEILNYLKDKITRNGPLAQVSINMTPQGLMLLGKYKRKIPSTEASENPDLKKEFIQLIDYRHPNPSQEHIIKDEYLEDRKKLEASLVFNGHYPVYGALAMNGKEWKEGASDYYGHIAVFLKNESIKDRVAFTSWDSAESEEISDFTFKHAIIIRAIYDYLMAQPTIYVDPQTGYSHKIYSFFRLGGSDVKYIEAQIIGGVTLDDIQYFKINLSDDPNTREKTKEFFHQLKQKYPDLAKKFNPF